jgi:phosphate transport system permease protein
MTESPAQAPKGTVPRPARLLGDFRPSAHVLLADRAARFGITGFGVFVILAVALILVFLGREAVPLFLSPTASARPDLRLPVLGEGARLLTWNTDEFHSYGYGVGTDGKVWFLSSQDGAVRHSLPLAGFEKSPPVAAWASPIGDRLVVADAEGQFAVAVVRFKISYAQDGSKVLTPSLKVSARQPLVPSAAGAAGKGVPREIRGAFNPTDESLGVAFLTAQGRLLAGKWTAPSESAELREISLPEAGKLTDFGVDTDVRFLVAAFEGGRLYRWNLWGSAAQPIQIIDGARPGAFVTRLALLLGGSTWILGWSDGAVEAWSAVRRSPEDAEFELKRFRSFESHAGPVDLIVPSGVNRGFWTADARGVVRMHFNPSARRLFTFDLGGAVAGIAPSAQLNGLGVLRRDGVIRRWEIRNPHPDVTLGMLFGKVWYEGYESPGYIWQSSSGSDNFEAKYSLVPLALGTIKGACFGLVFAIPVAVLAALYTSQLMHPRIRSVVKPTIEIMAALPSVVVGFLAGLWIAPFLEKHLVEYAIVLPMFLVLILGAAFLYSRLPLRVRHRVPQEAELGIMFGVVLLSLLLSHLIVGPAEASLFRGNVQQWVYDTLGQKVEQRNSLVIGLAMGFAVIPIIFSISEDAMSNVPRHYVSGSLALGATPWQSAVRVILPTASPGIFSAVMLGFGRAVGETMIVLMATGNTPVMSFSPFNGMRTLSANVAVEIPEAPHGGSLYRILFLGAVLLFVLTFAVNTAAEIVRMRLREKYRAM